VTPRRQEAIGPTDHTESMNVETGPLNTIADVAGVTVGHVTYSGGGHETGVTAIRPHLATCFVTNLLPRAMS